MHILFTYILPHYLCKVSEQGVLLPDRLCITVNPLLKKSGVHYQCVTYFNILRVVCGKWINEKIQTPPHLNSYRWAPTLARNVVHPSIAGRAGLHLARGRQWHRALQWLPAHHWLHPLVHCIGLMEGVCEAWCVRERGTHTHTHTHTHNLVLVIIHKKHAHTKN